MAKIENVSVSGLASSIFRSGYPMREKAPTPEEFEREVNQIEFDIAAGNWDSNPHIKRAIKLAGSAAGSGHDQYLTGINVNMDVTFSQKALIELSRYRFCYFISSMSTMHRASKLSLSEMCNEYVDEEQLDKLWDLQQIYLGEPNPEIKKQHYLKLLYSLPAGLELTTGMVTNYRSLRTIYSQRQNHRLPDWQVFCDFVRTLPLNILITGEIER